MIQTRIVIFSQELLYAIITSLISLNMLSALEIISNLVCGAIVTNIDNGCHSSEFIELWLNRWMLVFDCTPIALIYKHASRLADPIIQLLRLLLQDRSRQTELDQLEGQSNQDNRTVYWLKSSGRVYVSHFYEWQRSGIFPTKQQPIQFFSWTGTQPMNTKNTCFHLIH